VSQVDAANRMNIPFQRLNGIVKGRRSVSADTALLLEALTRWDAQIWLTLQAKWDLWHACGHEIGAETISRTYRILTEAGSQLDRRVASSTVSDTLHIEARSRSVR